MIGQAFPPGGPTTVENIIPSYPYVQYQDDDYIQAFVQAYNIYAQAYLDYLNSLNLPIYTDGNIAGSLLDWSALGIYGFKRPVFASPGTGPRGPFNTYQFNSLPYNTFIPGLPATFTLADDDTFKRVLTWHLYKGDGKVFNIRWFKRRVLRFLNGENGTDPEVNPYQVSVQFTGPYSVKVTVPNSSFAFLLQQGIAQGVLETPFQFTFTVSVTPLPVPGAGGTPIGLLLALTYASSGFPPNYLLDDSGQPLNDDSGGIFLTS